MPQSISRIYRIFVSHTRGMEREVLAMQGIANKINIILQDLLSEGIIVQVLFWEENVSPQIAHGGQSVIDDQISSYDIFLGLLANRFGTPVGDSKSGVEYEFRKAYARYEKHGAPLILFYFNTKHEPLLGAEEEAQLKMVEDFKAELMKKGIIGEYEGADALSIPVLPDLLRNLGKLLKHEQEVRSELSSAEAQSTGLIPGQMIPIRKPVKIFDIGEEDACYSQRDNYINHRGVILEAHWHGQWLRGTFRFDKPIHGKDDDKHYTFLQFQVEEIKGN